MWNVSISYYAENMPIIVSSLDQTVVCLVVVTPLSTWLCICTPAGSVNPLSQVVRPLTFGEISTTYKSRWYDNDHYNPLSLECSLLIGQQLRSTLDSYDQHMTVTITQGPQLRPTDVFEKWQLRPTLRNQNTPIVAKPSSAISITAVEVKGYLLPCIRTWLCQLVLLLVDDILDCLDSPFSAGAILVGGNCGWS